MSANFIPFPPARPADDVTQTSQTVAAAQLRAFIERIERLEEEKQSIADNIKEVYAELQEEQSILDLYKAALGMPS